MTQADRDRLVALKKAAKGFITRKQAAEELKISERQVYRVLAGMGERGDKVLIHGLRGQPSNRKLDSESEQKAMTILSDAKLRDFGPHARVAVFSQETRHSGEQGNDAQVDGMRRAVASG